MKNLFLTANLLLLIMLTACGYHTAGQAVKLPSDVHTIAIPVFINNTQSYRVEQVLTSAVVREFTSRTNYRIVNSPYPDADATLHGAVTSAQIYGTTYDPKNGRLSSAAVVVNAKVSLVDRKGKVLFENPNYSFREEYEFSLDPATFFREESPAMDRLSRDFARTLVSNILENY
jgi:outer membrane lipopolysaccharide assembly protein LptE/RlpB